MLLWFSALYITVLPLKPITSKAAPACNGPQNLRGPHDGQGTLMDDLFSTPFAILSHDHFLLKKMVILQT